MESGHFGHKVNGRFDKKITTISILDDEQNGYFSFDDFSIFFRHKNVQINQWKCMIDEIYLSNPENRFYDFFMFIFWPLK